MPNLTYVSLIQGIDCYARSILTGNEYIVLHFIIQRTYRYGSKVSEYIPMHHFTRGVFNSEGDLLVAAAVRDDRTARRSIAGLVEKGFIAVLNTQAATKAQTANKYTLLVDNIIEINCRIMSQSKLKLPKKSKIRKESEPPDIFVGGPPDKNAPLSNRLYEVIEKDKVRRHRSARRIADTVLDGVEKNKAARKRKLEKDGDKLTSSNLVAQWIAADEELKLSATPPTGFTTETFYKFKNGFNAAKLGIGLREFLRWCMREWVSVRGNELSWADNIPATPDLHTLSVLCRHFAIACKQRLASGARSTDRAELAMQRNQTSRQETESTEDLKRRLRELERENAHYKRIATQKTKTTRKRRSVTTEIPDALGEWDEK